MNPNELQPWPRWPQAESPPREPVYDPSRAAPPPWWSHDYPPPPKVKHTKGWAMGWECCFAVMTVIATFWLITAAANYTRPQCAEVHDANGTAHQVCVEPDNAHLWYDGNLQQP